MGVVVHIGNDTPSDPVWEFDRRENAGARHSCVPLPTNSLDLMLQIADFLWVCAFGLIIPVFPSERVVDITGISTL